MQCSNSTTFRLCKPNMVLPNLTKALSNIVQCAQNKCIRFCLQLGNKAHLDKEEFKDTRLNQCICVLAYNFYNNAFRAK